MTSMQLFVCIDVDDLMKAEAFYVNGLGLHVSRRFGDSVIEVLGASSPIHLLSKKAGSKPIRGNDSVTRSFERHWSPVHLDFVVDDLDGALKRATAAGAKLESDLASHVWGRIANCSDPFGNGFCLIQMSERGYDALL